MALKPKEFQNPEFESRDESDRTYDYSTVNAKLPIGMIGYDDEILLEQTVYYYDEGKKPPTHIHQKIALSMISVVQANDREKRKVTTLLLTGDELDALIETLSLYRDRYTAESTKFRTPKQ